MKLPPPATKASSTAKDAFSSAVQPNTLPPRQTGETLSPLRPISRISMGSAFPGLLGLGLRLWSGFRRYLCLLHRLARGSARLGRRAECRVHGALRRVDELPLQPRRQVGPFQVRIALQDFRTE